jgi:hypothetical protein
VRLFWLPLGAGGHVVAFNGRVYEALVARRAHRPPADLYHAALEVVVGADRFIIEMAPAWSSRDPDRGVVVCGPVGLRRLGRFAAFRYEVRRWRGGRIPDVSYAVDSPRRLETDVTRSLRLLDLVAHAPVLTWGRDELRAGEMWNSNALIAWLLAGSGHDVDAIEPPAGGRAPGWHAGLVCARRHGDRAS